MFTEKINKRSFKFSKSYDNLIKINKENDSINLKNRVKQKTNKSLYNVLKQIEGNIDENPYTTIRKNSLHNKYFTKSVFFYIDKKNTDLSKVADATIMLSKTFKEFKKKEDKVMNFTKD